MKPVEGCDALRANRRAVRKEEGIRYTPKELRKKGRPLRMTVLVIRR